MSLNYYVADNSERTAAVKCYPNVFKPTVYKQLIVTELEIS
jgi:hypothetical protein